MAQNRTDKCRFQSGFAEPGETIWVSDAQFLAETMCSRIAKYNKEYLSPKFWSKSPKALKDFRAQINHASKLLKEFPIDIILKALKHRRAAKVYSLGLRSVIVPLCEEISRANALTVPSDSPTIIAVDINQKPRVPLGSNSLINKLRDL